MEYANLNFSSFIFSPDAVKHFITASLSSVTDLIASAILMLSLHMSQLM